MRGSTFQLLLVVTGLWACGGGSGGQDAGGDDGSTQPDATPAPVFRNPVGLPDGELALEALKILGANVPAHDTRCNGCHPLTRSHIRYWRTLSDVSLADCLTDLAVSSQASAHQMVDCFRTDPQNPSANFTTPKIGVFASAARLPWFQHLFSQAYPGSTAEYDAFVMRVGMPPGASPNAPMTQEQFDIVAEWFIRGTPLLDQTLPEDPPPTTCFPSIASSVADHVADQATTGWRARNAEVSLNMYGCAGATNPLQCLQAVQPASSTTYGAAWDVAGYGQHRILKEFPVGHRSYYWARGSADGRFYANGLNTVPSVVVDLQDGGRMIDINARYDPAFFPDNSGFVFQSGTAGNVCAQNVLVGATSVDMNEPGCSDLGQVGLYEHVGRVVDGDYFAVDGQFESDDGGRSVTLRDPLAFFGSNSTIDLTPMIFNGTSFQPKATIDVEVPFEGDTVLSPSSRLLVSRLSGPNDRQLGFVLRRVDATPSGSTYEVSAPEIARYCLSGGKPAFSYDERWMVFHHYISPTSDADAQELGFTGADDPAYTSVPSATNSYSTRGSSNVFLLELTTGQVHRITRMNPGQYALYPHFRSDGWIYFQVSDIGPPGPGNEFEYAVASDAALQLE